MTKDEKERLTYFEGNVCGRRQKAKKMLLKMIQTSLVR